jgi:hypothetical protein
VFKGAALTLSTKVSTELGDGVDVALRPGFAGRDPQVALIHPLRLLETIAARDERRLVLFIDELQEIAGGDYADADHLTKQLRHAARC